MSDDTGATFKINKKNEENKDFIDFDFSSIVNTNGIQISYNVPNINNLFLTDYHKTIPYGSIYEKIDFYNYNNNVQVLS
jgi:hypothetical protein